MNRFALWAHTGVPDAAAIDRQWQAFAKEELASLKIAKPPAKKPAPKKKS
jgi:hypothetical protein